MDTTHISSGDPMKNVYMLNSSQSGSYNDDRADILWAAAFVENNFTIASTTRSHDYVKKKRTSHKLCKNNSLQVLQF